MNGKHKKLKICIEHVCKMKEYKMFQVVSDGLLVRRWISRRREKVEECIVGENRFSYIKKENINGIFSNKGKCTSVGTELKTDTLRNV